MKSAAKCLLLNLVLALYESIRQVLAFSVDRPPTLVAVRGVRAFAFVAAASLDLARLGWEQTAEAEVALCFRGVRAR